MILERGSYVLVAHRRLFDTDRPRFFIGKVDDYETGIARITGHTWTQDTFNGRVLKKEVPSTKVVSIASGTIIVYVLPEVVNLSSIKFEFDKAGNLAVSDGAKMQLDLTEIHHAPLSK